jgi:tetratricopeptide (TPR) repeat protein
MTLTGMTPTRRTLTLWVAAIAIASFGASSVASYRPGGVTDRARAVESLKRALAALDDEMLDSSARLSSYRDRLRGTDVFLRRTLRSNPLDTSSIERLATVRWELGLFAEGPNADSILTLIRVAAARAPRVPEIHADIGSLLYKMGRPVEAAPFMRRAVELSPGITSRVVASMKDAGVEPEAIASTFPQTAGVLALLREGFSRTNHLGEWLQLAEELLPKNPSELLASYSDACLEGNLADRLLEHVERLGVLVEKRAEAERQIAIGRAHLARKDWGSAASAAARARHLSPTDVSVLNFSGQLALAAGNPAEAELSFREALRALATAGGRAIDRARLYRQHGQALERLNRVEEAFDQYRRALEITPNDPWLGQRFAASSPKSVSDGHH